jgi:hypothetical protein
VKRTVTASRKELEKKALEVMRRMDELNVFLRRVPHLEGLFAALLKAWPDEVREFPELQTSRTLLFQAKDLARTMRKNVKTLNRRMDEDFGTLDRKSDIEKGTQLANSLNKILVKLRKDGMQIDQSVQRITEEIRNVTKVIKERKAERRYRAQEK